MAGLFNAPRGRSDEGNVGEHDCCWQIDTGVLSHRKKLMSHSAELLGGGDGDDRCAVGWNDADSVAEGSS